MEAEIFRTPPTSGEFTELRFNAVGDCAWVRFDAAESWVGVFGHGAFGSSAAVATSEADETAFVVAGGQGYLLDRSACEVVHLSEFDYLKSVIAVPESSLYVACSDTGSDLILRTHPKRPWTSSRYVDI